MDDELERDDQIPKGLDTEEWTRTTAALRRVARSVGASAAEAEDAAQGALLAGLDKRGREDAPGVGWLKTWVRHRTIDGLRGRSRAQVSLGEGSVEPEAAEPGPQELAVQFEVQRAVMGAVEKLPDPYRETVYLRYFEELSVPEIARRKKAPVATVRTWLTRAHRRLREDLLETDSDRIPGWSAAFVAFGRGPGEVASVASTSSLTVGSATTKSLTAAALLMTIKTLSAVAVTAAVLWFGYTALSSEAGGDSLESAEQGLGAAELITPPAEPSNEPSTDLAGGPPERAPAGRDPQDPAEGPLAASVPKITRIHGQVLDAAGVPVPSLRVRLEPPLPGVDAMTTDADGRVEGKAALGEESASKIVPVNDEFAVILWRQLNQAQLEKGLGGLLVVAPPRQISGTVRGTEGEAVAKAKLELTLPKGFRGHFDELLSSTGFESWAASSNAAGFFELQKAPSLEGCSLRVSASGYKPKVLEDLQVPVAGAASEPLEIVLEAVDPSQLVGGVVLDPDGAPVSGAYVSLGASVRRTGAKGQFKFQLDKDKTARKGPRRLVATAKGWCPVEFAPAPAVDGEPDWPEYTELRLEAETLSIEGVVLGRDGEPAAGHCVWVVDLTVIGVDEDNDPIVAENLGGGVTGLHKRHKTDAEGRFQLKELSPRRYKLVAMDLATLEKSLIQEVVAGDSAAVLRYDPAQIPVTLAGRVVNRRGEPIEGAAVNWRRFAMFVSAPGKADSVIDIAATEPLRSGADGSFQFPAAVFDEALVVRANAPGYLEFEIPVSDIAPPLDDLTLTLGARCQVKAFADPDPEKGGARSVSFFDGSGEKLKIWHYPEPNSVAQSRQMYLREGVSAPFEVADTAAQVVFYDKKGKPLSTQSVSLIPGKLNEIRQ